ncbi:MAG: hypothetical protein KAJ86_02235 [Alphaproteobacteria bacterium]|nr:hypothetical protein [Alphaproteobacteria bacterium]
MAKYKNKCAKSGFITLNNQSVINEDSSYSSNHESAKPWRLRCLTCGHEYGANGCDIHIRKCPECQGGAKGLDKAT